MAAHMLDTLAIIGIEGATLGALRCEFPHATVRRCIPDQDPVSRTGKVTALYKSIEGAEQLADMPHWGLKESVYLDRGWEITVTTESGPLLRWENKLSK